MELGSVAVKAPPAWNAALRPARAALRAAHVVALLDLTARAGLRPPRAVDAE